MRSSTCLLTGGAHKFRTEKHLLISYLSLLFLYYKLALSLSSSSLPLSLFVPPLSSVALEPRWGIKSSKMPPGQTLSPMPPPPLRVPGRIEGAVLFRLNKMKRYPPAHPRAPCRSPPPGPRGHVPPSSTGMHDDASLLSEESGWRS